MLMFKAAENTEYNYTFGAHIWKPTWFTKEKKFYANLIFQHFLGVQVMIFMVWVQCMSCMEWQAVVWVGLCFCCQM